MRFLSVLLFALILVQPASAQTFIGNFDDWSAFHSGAGKAKACYIASVPKKETGKYKTRGNTHVIVTHRPGEKARDIFELRAGYSFKKGSSVDVRIGGTKIRLFTDGGAAWAKNAKIDRNLTQNMKRGSEMTVHGTSSRGTRTVDTYSLKGFTAAYRAINKECKVK